MAPDWTKSEKLKASASCEAALPGDENSLSLPTTHSENTAPCWVGLLRTISDRIILPIVALSLSTPVISHAICLIGSRVLKRKMDKEADQMMSAARSYNHTRDSGFTNFHSTSTSMPTISKQEKKRQMAEVRAGMKRRKREAKLERKLLNKERKMLKRYMRNAREIDEADSSGDDEGRKVKAVPMRKVRMYRSAVHIRMWFMARMERFGPTTRSLKQPTQAGG
ncbi:hypothetical protein DRE_05201 [Drechslerella stenobrocha 248]|uniref:Uncharacterized protein n=1 Tax=Drechslerella stenobrocha 248 TaxID=1043628 RepID=W7I9C4_9PEZI|nr:hypothetical protein DRE_05201 [Drechslerella stenobrocha 248]